MNTQAPHKCHPKPRDNGGQRPPGMTNEEIVDLEVESCIADDNGCLHSVLSQHAFGYTNITDQHGRKTTLPRLICLVRDGPPPEGQEVRHLCGNAACNNPDHLAYGTHSENMRDTWVHGTHNRGERHYMNTLTEEDVRQIRHLYASGFFTYAELGEEFGINRVHAHWIAKRKSWKWLH